MRPQPDQSVLLIHTGAIGDFVLALALLKGLTAERSSLMLHALCRCRLACFVAKRGLLAGWKHIEQPTYLPLFSADLAAHSALRTYLDSFGMIIAMLGHTDSDVSLNLRSMTQAKLYCIDPALRQTTEQQGQHITDQWLRDLAEQGLSVSPQLTWPAGEPGRELYASSQDAHQLLWPPTSMQQSRLPPTSVGGAGSYMPTTAGFSRASVENRIVIHSGSGGFSKCWPLTDFEEVAARLVRKGRNVQFMLGPAEMERFDEDSRRRLARIAPVLYEEDVCDAAEHVAGAAVFIGNDAGMTHLAAFLGVPTVAIFTATDPTIWRPVGDKVSIIDARGGASVGRVISATREISG